MSIRSLVYTKQQTNASITGCITIVNQFYQKQYLSMKSENEKIAHLAAIDEVSFFTLCARNN